MSTIVERRSGIGWLSRVLPGEQLVGRICIWLGVLLLLASIIFPMHLQDRFPYNFLPSLPISFFVMLGCIAFRGKAVMRVTPFDYVLIAWIIFNILSHLNSWYVLHRTIYEIEAIGALLMVFNMWFVYRAVYGMTIIDPRTTFRAVFYLLLSFILICTVIGILQSVGPLQDQMVSLAYRIGVGETQIKLGASEMTGVRTTSVFSGPNIFGFINLIGASLLVAAAMALKERLKEIHSVVVLMGLGLIAYANLNSQSRFTFVLAALVGVVYIVFLIRAAKWRALLMACIMFVMFAIGTVILTSQGRYEYMTSIFKTGVQNDFSYQVRMKGIDRLGVIANDIPIIGAGHDMYSLVLYGKGDFYSKANGAGDNGLLMAYFLMGIPGVIHLLYWNFAGWRALRQLKTEDQGFIKTLKYSGWMLWWLYVLTIPYSIRFHKFETVIYYLIVFAMIFGVMQVQRTRDLKLATMGLEPGAKPPQSA